MDAARERWRETLAWWLRGVEVLLGCGLMVVATIVVKSEARHAHPYECGARFSLWPLAFFALLIGVGIFLIAKGRTGFRLRIGAAAAVLVPALILADWFVHAVGACAN